MMDTRWNDPDKQERDAERRSQIMERKKLWNRKFLRPVQMIRDCRPLFRNKQPGVLHRKGRID